MTRSFHLLFVVTCVLFVWVFVFSYGCSNDSSDTEKISEALEVKLLGALEKGPFVLGSSVAISPVDASGSPTGQVFNSQTMNDLGEFNVSFEAGGFVALEGDGFYYNEVTGELSQAPIALRAFYEIVESGVQYAYVNILTHLSYERIKTLIGEKNFDAAKLQAERELREALKIGPPQGLNIAKDAIEMTLQGGDSLDNAYLFAVSAVLAQAAAIRSPSSPDAALQELSNAIAIDLSDDGALSQGTVDSLKEAQIKLDPEDVMQKLSARLEELGSDATVPDLNRVLDYDFDGFVNADDNCRWAANPNQADSDGDGIGDVCDDCEQCHGIGSCNNREGECVCYYENLTDDCGKCELGMTGYPDCVPATPMWTDPDSGLTWQNPPYDELFEGEEEGLRGLPWIDAIEYCNNLSLEGFSDWRLPSISELRALIRGCPNMETLGSCGVSDSCLNDICRESCSECDYNEGPANGCYWPDEMLGMCVDEEERNLGYWSSSKFADDPAVRWGVYYSDGNVGYHHQTNIQIVRCIRGGRTDIPRFKH